ncbi:MAG: phage protein Gp36 family protein [Kiritimatiellia bacterium]
MWRKITKEDLHATLSEQEIRAFGQTDAFDASAVERQVANTVAAVRGFVRSGRRCRMSPDESTLPEMLVSPAMDVAAFNLLKRFNRVPNEARTKAAERAQDLFERIAAGAVVPEDHGEEPADASPAAAAPAFSPPSPVRLLD